MLRYTSHRPSAPGVMFAPQAHRALQHGIDLLANLVRPTLGPTPRGVLVASNVSDRAPEVLDDAATILRRVIEISDPYANMGAMLLRHTAWRAWETAGDGAATTAVLTQTLVRHAGRYLADGGNAVAFRRGLEHGLAVVLSTLEGQVVPLRARSDVERLATQLSGDAELAALLGEIFEVVGADGFVQVENGYTHALDRQFVGGVHWYEGYLSPHFAGDSPSHEVHLANAAVLISDLRLTTAESLVPLLDRLRRTGQRRLMIVAHEVSGSALGLLLSNRERGLLDVVAVKAPFMGVQRTQVLQDLAVLLGGRVVTHAAGDLAEHTRLDDLGTARFAWAGPKSFGMRGGRGDPRSLRRRIGELRAELAAATDTAARDRIRERLSKLYGGVAIVLVGGNGRSEIEARKAVARRTITAVRSAISDGVVPGGGSAYLACQACLATLDGCREERAAAQALAAALEEPLRVIARNAGAEASTVLARAKQHPAGYGFDAAGGTIVDMCAAGIVDPLRVVQAALEAAVSGATMSLSTEVLIHQRAPVMVAKP